MFVLRTPQYTTHTLNYSVSTRLKDLRSQLSVWFTKKFRSKSAVRVPRQKVEAASGLGSPALRGRTGKVNVSSSKKYTKSPVEWRTGNLSSRPEGEVI